MLILISFQYLLSVNVFLQLRLRVLIRLFFILYGFIRAHMGLFFYFAIVSLYRLY
jgi:hypothetical protein